MSVTNMIVEQEAKMKKSLEASAAKWGATIEFNDTDVVYINFAGEPPRRYKLQIPPLSEIQRQVRQKRQMGSSMAEAIEEIGKQSTIPENNHTEDLNSPTFAIGLAKRREMLNFWPEIYFAFLWPQGYL